MKTDTKKITTVAMLCAMAFAAVALLRIPVVMFLKYDPKDIMITLGGLIMGPVTALTITVIVSVIEMVTISDTGIIGLIMNILSSAAFACTAAYFYRKKHSLSGAVIGLAAGCAAMVVIMLLWNYLITPIYMGYPREAVAKMLLPIFLPFNLLKGGLNAAFTFILYKPVVTALRRAGYVSTDQESHQEKHMGMMIFAAVIIITCILWILSMNGLL